MTPKTGLGTVAQRIQRFSHEGRACTCFNLRKAARAITQLYDEAMRETGLRANQVSLLGVTLELEPVTVTRLSQATVTDRTTLTRNLRQLEKQRLIRVTPGDDRRERVIALTERGREALAGAYPKWKEAQARVAQSVGQERLQRLLSDLSALVAATRRR
jgi:DNA-binding MarR family transcriptional regulator